MGATGESGAGEERRAEERGVKDKREEEHQRLLPTPSFMAMADSE